MDLILTDFRDVIPLIKQHPCFQVLLEGDTV